MEFEPKLKIPDNVLLAMRTLPTIELLHVLQDYNNQMLEESRKKTELLCEYNSKLAESEYKFNSLLHVIEEKMKQLQEQSRLYKADQIAENEWDARVKLERHKRLASLQEYQTKMAELRSTLKSSVVFNEELVTKEINELKNQIEITMHDIDSSSLLVSSKEAQRLLDTDEEIIIDHLNSLTKEFEISVTQETAEILKLETEFNQITEVIKKMELNQ